MAFPSSETPPAPLARPLSELSAGIEREKRRRARFSSRTPSPAAHGGRSRGRQGAGTPGLAHLPHKAAGVGDSSSVCHRKKYLTAMGGGGDHTNPGPRPTESLGRCSGPDRRHDPSGARAVTRLDVSMLDATLRQSDDLLVHALCAVGDIPTPRRVTFRHPAFDIRASALGARSRGNTCNRGRWSSSLDRSPRGRWPAHSWGNRL
jgi:hypothetical protein